MLQRFGGSFSNRDNVRAASLKVDFLSMTDPFIFTSIVPQLYEWSNETSSVFPALRSICHSLMQSTVSRRSNSS